MNGQNLEAEICLRNFSSPNNLILFLLRSLATLQSKRMMILFTQKKVDKKALRNSAFLKTKKLKSLSAVTNTLDRIPSLA